MKKEEILQQLADKTIGVEEATKMLAELDAPKKGRQLYCKVSAKGGISVYHLQRMPVTLYVEQWQRLLDFADQIREFMAEHDAELTRKNAGPTEE